MLKDYNKPKRDWTNKQWINYCSIQVHNPWINEQEREYYKDKLTEIYSSPHCSQPEAVETENEMNYWRNEYQEWLSS